MKKLLTLAVISLMFLGTVATQEKDRNNEVCGDTVCETAENLGLYSEIEQIDLSIEKLVLCWRDAVPNTAKLWRGMLTADRA